MGTPVDVNPGRGEEAARTGIDEEDHEALVERLRRLEWPKPEAGEAERAFERFKSALDRSRGKR